MATQKQVRAVLDGLSRKPQAYLRSSEHYDVSSEGETRRDWIREAAEDNGYDPYIVEINTGGFTGTIVAVVAGHPDEALETADEWACTFYYDSNYEECEEARGRGEGVVRVYPLMEAERRNNPGHSSGVTSSELTRRLKF